MNEQPDGGPPPDLSAAADAVRTAERAAIERLALNVAFQAARAAGYKHAAQASVNFVEMVLREAFAARDAELAALRQPAAGDQG